jgi:hypothetical protein
MESIINDVAGEKREAHIDKEKDPGPSSVPGVDYRVLN